MKKMFLFSIICMFAVASQAQNTLVWPNGKVRDTSSNTGGKNAVTVSMKLRHNMFSCQVNVIKISGAPAGKIYWDASNDGTYYFPVDSVTVVDSAVASYKYASTTEFPYFYFRARQKGTGTMSVALTGTIYIRRDY